MAAERMHHSVAVSGVDAVAVSGVGADVGASRRGRPCLCPLSGMVGRTPQAPSADDAWALVEAAQACRGLQLAALVPRGVHTSTWRCRSPQRCVA